MKLILFGDRATPFVEKVARGLILKKLEFEVIVPQSPEDLWTWNPEKGEIPVLQIGEERIIDSTRILERIDAEVPEPPFVSSDPKTAAAQRRLEDWSDEIFLWYWRAWRRAVEAQSAAGEGHRVPSWLRPLARALGAGASPGKSSGADPAAVVRDLGRRFDDLVGFLGDRPFFYSDTPGMADVAVYSGLRAVRTSPMTGAAEEFERRPALHSFLDRVEDATGGA